MTASAAARRRPRILFLPSWLVLLAGLTLSGCPSSNTSGDATEDAVETTDGEPVKLNKLVGTPSDRDSLAGRWLMVLVRGPAIQVGGVFEVDPQAQPPVSIVDLSHFARFWEVESASVEGDRLRMTLANARPDMDAVPLHINATLRDGRLDGELMTESGVHNEAQFIAWDREKAPAEPKDGPPPPPPGFQLLELALSQGADPDKIEELIEKYPGSPITKTAQRMLVTRAIVGDLSKKPEEREPADDDTIRRRVEEYMTLASAWGPGSEARAAVQTAIDLAVQNRLDAATIQELAERGENPEARLSEYEDYNRRIAPLIAAVREGDRLDEARELIDEQIRKRPYDTILYKLRTELAQATETKEDDLEYVAELTTLPSMGGASPTQLLGMYRDIHGEDVTEDDALEALTALLRRLYRERTRAFVPEEPPKLPEIAEGESRRHVLIEMFTGGSCAPCVASDIALAALDESYGDEVTVIRYHLNIPGPDPLASDVAAMQAEKYGVEQTPTIFINGRNVNPTGRNLGLATLYGDLPNAPAAYELYEALIESRLAETSPIEIEGKFDIEGYDMASDFRVTGVTPEQAPGLRMRALLLEREVELRAQNGILIHENVVRHTFTSPLGYEFGPDGAIDGEMKLSLQYPQLRLVTFAGDSGIPLTPELKARILEMDDPAVAIIIQDAESNLIVQSAVFPVSGGPPDVYPFVMEDYQFSSADNEELFKQYEKKILGEDGEEDEAEDGESVMSEKTDKQKDEASANDAADDSTVEGGEESGASDQKRMDGPQEAGEESAVDAAKPNDPAAGDGAKDDPEASADGGQDDGPVVSETPAA